MKNRLPTLTVFLPRFDGGKSVLSAVEGIKMGVKGLVNGALFS
ncbi:MAG TPA: hypothetical protein VHJ56_08040 [Candidatus Binatia bacterium]|nr:hypothetical protein [Candidatus Binatia bacterium]